MMKKRTKLLTIIALMALCVVTVAIGLVGCGGGGSFADLSDFEMTVGETVTLTAEGDDLTWSTSSAAVATVTDGKVTAVGEGTATISVSDGKNTESCVVTVKPKPVSAVPTLDFDISQRTVVLGGTLTLEPKLLVSGAAVDGATFTYESADQTIATVSEAGVISGIKTGRTTVTVTWVYGDYFDSVQVSVNVTVNAVFEIDTREVTLAIYKSDEGIYNVTKQINITKVLLNGNDVHNANVTYSSKNQTIATVSADGLISAAGVGETVVTATFHANPGNADADVSVDISVTVIKEEIEVTEKGSVDASRDYASANPSDSAFVILPNTVQIADEKVISISDKDGTVLSEEKGLSVPKSCLNEKEKVLYIDTANLTYKLTVVVNNSCIKITNYDEQFTNYLGNQATAYDGEMDGRTDVVVTTSTTAESVWYAHCGYLKLDAYGKTWKDGILIFDVKAEEGTPVGFYAKSLNIYFDPSTMKFDEPCVKIVDKDFNETTFTYGEWNTVVIDYSTASDGSDMGEVFLPSFKGPVTSGYTAYYSNFRYMSQETFAQLIGEEAAATEYTVKFAGIDGIADQKVGYRGKVTVPTVDASYKLKGWMINDVVVDLENFYVTENVTFTAFIDAKANYTVKHMRRTQTGAYVEYAADTATAEAQVGSTVTATAKTYEGYTVNTALSVTSGKVKTDGSLVLAIYYENDSYTFNKVSITAGSGISITDKAMTDVPAENFRPNTLFFKETTGAGSSAQYNTLNHGTLNSGDYLLLNVYITKIDHSYLFFKGRVGTTWTYMDDVGSVALYNAKGEKIGVTQTDDGPMIDNTTAMVNSWTTIAIKITDDFNGVSSSLVNFTVWSPSLEMYIGEYTVVSAADFNTLFGND